MATADLEDVKVVENRGLSTVVEWREGGKVKRALVPRDQIINGKCLRDVLMQCPSMSVDWAEYFKLSITPKRLSDELRRNGIWTVEDFEANPDRVFRAVSRLVVRDLLKMVGEVKSGR